MDGTREPSTSTTSHSLEGSNTSHAFQVCTLDSSQQMPLSFETPVSMKQRRKRTSPRDHSILEAAYQRNSKPDKEERAELVQRVALGEKEVQIWFQNRRQNDRRKSKPLLPHELIPHFRNGVPNEVARQLASPDGSQSHVLPPTGEHPTSSPPEVTRPVFHASNIQKLLNPTPRSQTEFPIETTASPPNTHTLTPPSSFDSTCSSASETQPAGEKPPLVQHESSPDSGLDRLARKRSHEEMATTNPSQTESRQSEQQVHKLQRSSSFVRLAVTADGSFKIRTGDEPTPSPPKQRTASPHAQNTAQKSTKSGLTRSQSVIENGLNFKDINPPIKRAPGRSRDARTWEFYCDKGAREALASQAEEQEHGSAVNAINIMRSGNQPKLPALSPNIGKQNRNGHAAGRRHKPEFSRAQSSMARLQNSIPDAQENKSTEKPRNRSNSGGDSDKENWMPGTRNSQNAMRRMHPSVPRDSVLQEYERETVSRLATESSEQHNPDKSIVSAGGTKAEDLDCIQGLLSLSQGAWR